MGIGGTQRYSIRTVQRSLTVEDQERNGHILQVLQSEDEHENQ